MQVGRFYGLSIKGLFKCHGRKILSNYCNDEVGSTPVDGFIAYNEFLVSLTDDTNLR